MLECTKYILMIHRKGDIVRFWSEGNHVRNNPDLAFGWDDPESPMSDPDVQFYKATCRNCTFTVLQVVRTVDTPFDEDYCREA